MIITDISLKNYRNYNNISLDFSNEMNIIEGKNASGKTNLVEAIYFCGVGRSPRTSKDKDLILWGASDAYISLTVKKKYRSHKIEVFFTENGKKRILIDGGSISRIGELMGVLNVVFFCPDDLKLVKQSPQERRTFMDISLCQQSKIYFYTLLKYNRILLERNKLLKNAKSINELKDTLPVWNIQLAEYGAQVIAKRLDFLLNINPIADKIHRSIAGINEGLELIYEKTYEGFSIKEIKESLSEKLSQNIEKDYALGYTLTGLHRDDFLIKSNNIELRSFGSQGQQRTAALSIKLAEIEYFKQKTGELPVLLLDDVFSELDQNRRNSLLNEVSNIQTFITCTEFIENFSSNYKVFTVNNGIISY